MKGCNKVLSQNPRGKNQESWIKGRLGSQYQRSEHSLDNGTFFVPKVGETQHGPDWISEPLSTSDPASVIFFPL